MKRCYGYEIKKRDDAFWDRVKWLRKEKKAIVYRAASVRGKPISVKALQSRFKAKPVTLPKIGGDA